MHRTGILTDPRFSFHNPGDDFPENPGRMAELPRALLPFNGHLVPLDGRLADPAQLERVHSPAHVRRIAATAGREYTALSSDTCASAGSYLSARLAVGACQSATEAVMSGRADQYLCPDSTAGAPRRIQPGNGLLSVQQCGTCGDFCTGPF